jgi:hypothetical protein
MLNITTILLKLSSFLNRNCYIHTMRLLSLPLSQQCGPHVRSIKSPLRAFPTKINAATAQLTVKIGTDSDELMQAARLRAEAYYEVRMSLFL